MTEFPFLLFSPSSKSPKCIYHLNLSYKESNRWPATCFGKFSFFHHICIQKSSCKKCILFNSINFLFSF